MIWRVGDAAIWRDAYLVRIEDLHPVDTYTIVTVVEILGRDEFSIQNSFYDEYKVGWSGPASFSRLRRIPKDDREFRLLSELGV